MEKVHQEEQSIARRESRLLVERYLLGYGKCSFSLLLKAYDREEMPKVEDAIQQLEAESQTEASSLREIAKTADELIAEANELKKQRGRLKDEMVRGWLMIEARSFTRSLCFDRKRHSSTCCSC